MGRYYHGDIEGKFWFGIQPSDDPAFFGAEEEPRDYISFYTEDLEKIAAGIDTCKNKLGKYYNEVDKFYSIIINDPKHAQTLQEWLDIDEGTAHYLMEWYARLELGRKMYKQVKENGSCSIEAEV